MSTGKTMYYLRIQVLLVDGGTMVLRKVFDEKKTPTNPSLSTCLVQNRGVFSVLRKKGIINSQQYALLTSSGPTITSFDISLLTCLLRNICGLKHRNDPCWSSPPGQTDFSIEADLMRFRTYRNEFAHISVTSALSENDFNTKWSDIEQVLVRLNSHLQNGVLNLQLELDKLKSKPLDEDADELYQQEIKEWQDMDAAMEIKIDYLSKDFTEMKKVMETIADNVSVLSKMTPEQKSIHESSQLYFENEKEKMEYYVKTNVYHEACKKLQTSGIVILSGHPYEGKTSMAVCLLLEIAQESKLLRLSGPDDWRLVDLDAYTAVLIDDIFGNALLDEYMIQKWEKFLMEIGLAASKKKKSFVITTRHYILQEAKEKLNRHEILEKENVIMVSSSRLNPEEKSNILVSHLKKNKREVQANLLESVNMQWGRRMTKSSKKAAVTVGFPGCAAMFASSDDLFDKGAEFFSSPYEFFHRCIQEISKKNDEFMPLVFVWTKSEGKLSASDFDASRNRTLQKELGHDYNYPFENMSKNTNTCLQRHMDEFLVFSSKTGEYSFSHSVISDVVGIVCAHENAAAVIKHASRDFIMKCVTTLPSSDSDLIVHIEEYKFPILIEKFYRMIFVDENTHTQLALSFYDILRIKDDAIENTKRCQAFPVDLTIIRHDAFENKDFIKKFVNILWGREESSNRIKTPLIDAFEIFKAKFCITFDDGVMGMTLPIVMLAKKKDWMVYECMNKSYLKENEPYLAMLLAVRDGNRELVKELIRYGITANEDALQIATGNEDLEMLNILMKNKSKPGSSSHIQNGNSPLITAAKRRSVEVARCLLEGGVDVNYRNENNISALDKAVIWNNIEICRLLLEYGANLNEKGGKFQRTPIHTAVDMGHTDIVKLLLRHGAEVSICDHRHDYPCQTAAMQGHAEILWALLVKDKSLGTSTLCHNGKNISKGMSLYHIAIVQGNRSVLKVLIEIGINPNIKDRFGRTPLYLAVFYGKTQFVQILLSVADPNLSEKNGYTLLHAAIYIRHLETVELLCRHPQINVNQADKRGVTALHLACKTANFEIIVELLKVQSLDVRMKTKKGKSVNDILQTTAEGQHQTTIENVRKCVEVIRQKDPNIVNFLDI